MLWALMNQRSNSVWTGLNGALGNIEQAGLSPHSPELSPGGEISGKWACFHLVFAISVFTNLSLF